MLAELGIDHCHFAMLHDKAEINFFDYFLIIRSIVTVQFALPFDAFHGLARIVGHYDVGRDFLAMVVDLAIQSALQVDLALGESEALADK